jgi:hypothetical protein
MFIALRMGITDEEGVCQNNTGEDSLCSGLASATVDGAIFGPVKGRLSDAA